MMHARKTPRLTSNSDSKSCANQIQRNGGMTAFPGHTSPLFSIITEKDRIRLAKPAIRAYLHRKGAELETTTPTWVGQRLARVAVRAQNATLKMTPYRPQTLMLLQLSWPLRVMLQPVLKVCCERTAIASVCLIFNVPY